MLNWNSIDDTKECLESFKKVTYPNYEIIVVDNGSATNEAELLSREYGNQATVIATGKNLGFPGGNNVGIEMALNNGSEFCLLINNDVVVDPEFLTELVKVGKDPSVGLSGSKIYNYYNRNRVDSAGGKAWYWLMILRNQWSEEDDGRFDRQLDRDFIIANGMLVSKRVFEKVGLLDPDFFFGAEEYDLCIRVKRAGFRMVFVPTSKIYHKWGRSRAKIKDYPETAKIIKENMGLGYSRYYYGLSRKHFPPLLFVIPFTSHYLLVEAPKALFGPPVNAMRIIVRHKDIGYVLNGVKRRVRRVLGMPEK